jgi:anti-sigma regulatory factor (Ser/Thr protein kinase)
MHPFDMTTGLLDREFDAHTLAELRQTVLGFVTACGMPGDRAIEVMLAVHELAANAVLYGPGHGRLRIHRTASTLRCQVSDSGMASLDHHVPGGTGGHTPAAARTVPWPVERGHGLWLVHAAADQLRATTGARGSLATAVFILPAAVNPPQGCRPGARADADPSTS